MELLFKRHKLWKIVGRNTIPLMYLFSPSLTCSCGATNPVRAIIMGFGAEDFIWDLISCCCDTFEALPAVIGTVLKWQILWIVSFGTGSGVWKINPVCECTQPKRCIPSQEQCVELNECRWFLHSQPGRRLVSFGSTQEVGEEQVNQQDLSLPAVMELGKPKLLLHWIWRGMGRGPGDKEQERGQGRQWILWLSIEITGLGQRESPEQERLSLGGGWSS